MAWMHDNHGSNLINVQIDSYQRFLKLWSSGNDAASRIANEAVTVEDQLILTANQVAVGDKGFAISRAPGDHAFSLLPIIHPIG